MAVLKDGQTYESICDGCGQTARSSRPTGEERDDLETMVESGERRYCERCAERREGDREILVRGRTLLFSEAKMQAAETDDEDLKSAVKAVEREFEER